MHEHRLFFALLIVRSVGISANRVFSTFTTPGYYATDDADEIVVYAVGVPVLVGPGELNKIEL